MHYKAFIFSIVIAASLCTTDYVAAALVRVGNVAHVASQVAGAIGGSPIPAGVAAGSAAGAYILGAPGGIAVGAAGGLLQGASISLGIEAGSAISGTCFARGAGSRLPEALVAGAASVAGAGATSAAFRVVATALTSSAPGALVIGAATAATGRGLYTLFSDQLIAPGRIAEAVKLGAERAATAAFLSAVVSIAARAHAAYSGTHYLGR